MDILTEEQKEELDRRLDAYHQNPEEGSSWDAVRQRIRDRT
jgi:putative addiction module component (TIGR02574 family)